MTPKERQTAKKSMQESGGVKSHGWSSWSFCGSNSFAGRL